MTVNRIAFTGRAGVGKTTAAQYLVANKIFHKIALADKLKEICKDLWPDQFKDGNKPRELLQTIGTDRLRAYDPDVWVNYAVRQMVKLDTFDRVIRYTVDDCRFLNEARILRKNGFTIVKIDGPQRIAMAGNTSQHVSETEQDGIEPDYILPNEGTIGDLHHNILDLIELIKENEWLDEIEP